jgi:predicted GIY-YIG superfamily endonuclease
MKQQHLYRFFDDEGNLLYVGISNSWTQRFHQHERSAAWFQFVASATFEKYPDRESVERAELIAIQTENPIHNKKHNDNYESPMDHFNRLKSWTQYGGEDDAHRNLVEAMRAELKQAFAGIADKRGQFFAAVFIDNYGLTETDAKCRNCDAINATPHYSKWAAMAWEKVPAL